MLMMVSDDGADGDCQEENNLLFAPGIVPHILSSIVSRHCDDGRVSGRLQKLRQYPAQQLNNNNFLLQNVALIRHTSF